MNVEADDRLYQLVFRLVFAVVFIGCWAYCIVTYGFLLGVGLGWLPSLIAAFVAAALWPVILIILAIVYIRYFR